MGRGAESKGTSVLLAKSARHVNSSGGRALYSMMHQEGENPFNNIESYDNFFYAALQVAIISTQSGVCFDFQLVCAGTNTTLQFTSPMYLTIDAEYFLSCFFYITCVIVLNLWLINLFVAVITNTFSAIRKETQKSAFGAAQ